MARKHSSGDEPVTIKKYANRRLYNTATSSYVTLDDLCQMVKDNVDFVVYDAKSGEDITRSVLTQIIVEEESKGQNLLPIKFLRQLIALYGDSLQSLVPRYLDYSMDSFAQNQDQMRSHMQNAFDGLFPFGSAEEMSKQNAAFLEQAMKMFSPFEGFGTTGSEPPKPESPSESPPESPKSEKPAPTPGEDGESLSALKERIDALQRQLEELSDKNRK